MKDYYNILRIRTDATPEEIKQGYKNQVKKYHPDNFTGPAEESKQRMVELQEAYEFLWDPDKKRRYDASRRAETKPPPGTAAQNGNTSHTNARPESDTHSKPDPPAAEPFHSWDYEASSRTETVAEQVGGCIGCLIYIAIAIGILLFISSLLRSCNLDPLGKSGSDKTRTQAEQGNSNSNSSYNSLPAKDKKMLDATKRYLNALLAGDTGKMRSVTQGNKIRAYSRDVIDMLYAKEEEQSYLQSVQKAMRQMQCTLTDYTMDSKKKSGTVTIEITTVNMLDFENKIQPYFEKHWDEYVDAIAEGTQEEQVLKRLVNQFVEDGNLTTATNPLVLRTQKRDGKWKVTGTKNYTQYVTAFFGGDPDDI